MAAAVTSMLVCTQEHFESSEYSLVPGAANPAYFPPRRYSPRMPLESTGWEEPSFLKDNRSSWPSVPLEINENEVLAETVKSTCNTVNVSMQEIPEPRCSSHRQNVAVGGWGMRFGNACRWKTRKKRNPAQEKQKKPGNCISMDNEEVFNFNQAPGGSQTQSVPTNAPIDIMNENDFELPPGFKVIDGVVMDTTNLLVQHATPNATEYKLYEAGRDFQQLWLAGQVIFRRPQYESGWHYILFEDPMEFPGSGHMIFLQRLLGFSITRTRNNDGSSDIHLYEAFHIDLSDNLGGSADENFNNNPIDIGDQQPDETNRLDPTNFLFDTLSSPSSDSAVSEAGEQQQQIIHAEESYPSSNYGNRMEQGMIDISQNQNNLGNSNPQIRMTDSLPNQNIQEQERYMSKGHASRIDMSRASFSSFKIPQTIETTTVETPTTLPTEATEMPETTTEIYSTTGYIMPPGIDLLSIPDSDVNYDNVDDYIKKQSYYNLNRHSKLVPGMR
ncbi:unnamed protein product [Orchesella dallaii]|uniref:Uncharacterized protein n=1 Tax=Orchesella dallaii TaxID=48710 RepID=A0ABP1S9X4_9HEXA